MTFQNKMESPSTGAGLSVASRFSRVVLVIGLQIFIAKVLDDTSYGSYIVVFAGANFLFFFLDLGFSPSTARLLARTRQENAREKAAAIVTAAYLSRLSVAAITVLSVPLFVPCLVNFLDEPAYLTAALPMAIYAACCGLVFLGDYLFQALLRVRYCFYVSLVQSVFNIILVAVFMQFNPGPTSIMWALALSGMLSAGLSFWLLNRLFPIRLQRFSLTICREFIPGSFPFFFRRLSGFLNLRTGTFLLAYYVTKESVTYFTFPLQIVEKICLPLGAMGLALGPHCVQSSSGESLTDRQQKILFQELRLGLIFMVPCWCVLFLHSVDFIRLFANPTFSAAAEILRPAAVMIFLLGVCQICTPFLDYRGLAPKLVKFDCLALTVNIGLGLYLIPSYGSMGAMCACLLAHSIYAVCVLELTRKVSGIEWLWFGCSIRNTGLACVPFAACYFLLPPMNPLIGFPLSLTIGSMGYLGIILVLKELEMKDLKEWITPILRAVYRKKLAKD